MTATEPTIRVLSLGAGRQSTALAILGARGDLGDRLDAAIFSDTGWEPRYVYDHLDRLDREVLAPAGIPLYRGPHACRLPGDPDEDLDNLDDELVAVTA